MPKTSFVFHQATIFERATSWVLVLAFVALIAFALHRWARWPWFISVPAGAVGYVVMATAIVYGRLAPPWWSNP